jgi:hypothetical protein
MKISTVLLILVLCVSCSKIAEPLNPIETISKVQGHGGKNKRIVSGNLELACLAGQTKKENLTAKAVINIYKKDTNGAQNNEFRYQIMDKNKNMHREIVAAVHQYHIQDGVCWLIAQVNKDSKGCEVGPHYCNHGEICPYRECEYPCTKVCKRDGTCKCDCSCKDECVCPNDCPANDCECTCHHPRAGRDSFNCHDWCCIGECCDCHGCTGDSDDCLQLKQRSKNRKGNGKNGSNNGEIIQNRWQKNHSMSCRVGQFICIRLGEGEKCKSGCDCIAWRWCDEKEQAAFQMNQRTQWPLCEKNILKGDICTSQEI